MFAFLTRRLWLLVILAFLLQIAGWILVTRLSRSTPGTRPLPTESPAPGR